MGADNLVMFTRNLLSICLIMVLVLACRVMADNEDSPTQNKGPLETGPTICIDVESDNPLGNPVEAFMYFVPIVSPIPVESIVDEDNQQRVRITSCNTSIKRGKFTTVCNFQMWGSGHHKNIFDTKKTILSGLKEIKHGKTLANMIEYIKFEGLGQGSMKVKGKIVKGVKKVTSVEIKFNEAQNKSPITIGLYSVECKKGKYLFENRFDQQVARVNTLKFKADNSTEPRMEIEIASLGSTGSKEGFYSKFKAKIANLFIKPLLITKQGNQVMLQFGEALNNQHATYTFPKAKNLIVAEKPKKQEDTIVATATEDQEIKVAKAD